MFVPHSWKSHLVFSFPGVAMVLVLTIAAAFPQARDSKQFLVTDSISPAGQVASEQRRHPVPPRLGSNFRANAVNSVAPAFSLQAYDSGGIEASAVAVGDLNGDGWPDLAVANACTISWMSCTGGGSVGVFMNAGGSFSGPGVYPSGGSYTSGIGIADVNLDNKADVVVASYCNGSDYSCIARGELLGNGDGGLQSVQPYSDLLRMPTGRMFPISTATASSI